MIVDEGQDFKDLWWLVLEALLKPHGPAVLRIFADNNQRVYRDASKLTKELQVAPIALSWNLRNTKSIHEVAYRHYQGASVRCEGPAGEPPQLVEANDRPGIVRVVERIVRSLTVEHAVAPEEIAILVPNDTWHEAIVRQGRVAGVACRGAGSPQQGNMLVDTVRRFKGLEALITIVVVDASLTANDELAYVALSRARTRTYLVGQQRHLKGLVAVDADRPPSQEKTL